MKIKLLILSLIAFAPLCLNAANVVWPMSGIVGVPNNRQITLSTASGNAFIVGTNWVSGSLVIDPTNGTAITSNLAGLVFTVAIDGVSGTFRMDVPDDTNTYSAIDLIRRGLTLSQPQLHIASGTNTTITTNNLLGIYTVTVNNVVTNLNASQLLSGTLPDARLSSNIPLLNGPNNQIFNSYPIFRDAGPGAIAFQNGIGEIVNVDFSDGEIDFVSTGGVSYRWDGPIIGQSFSGDGSGLTSLSAASLTGTVPTATLPASVVQTNSTAGFTNTGKVVLSNPNNAFSGSFTGNGQGLTNLVASSFSFTNLSQASTNYAVDFSAATYTVPLNTSANICFSRFTNGVGAVSYFINTAGTNLTVLWPTNTRTLVTNGLTLNGTNWSYTLTNKANAQFVWSAFAATNIQSFAAMTNVTVGWSATP